ncbi:hypothetical protein ABIC03_000051 [Bradyrhizobium sp. RT6a]
MVRPNDRPLVQRYDRNGSGPGAAVSSSRASHRSCLLRPHAGIQVSRRRASIGLARRGMVLASGLSRPGAVFWQTLPKAESHTEMRTHEGVASPRMSGFDAASLTDTLGTEPAGSLNPGAKGGSGAGRRTVLDAARMPSYAAALLVIGAQAWTAYRSASCRQDAARSGSSGLACGIPVFDSATFDPLCFSKISRGREMASREVGVASPVQVGMAAS